MMTTTAVTAALAVPAVAVAVALSHLNRHQQDPRRRRPRQGHRQGRRRHWCRCLLLHTRTNTRTLRTTSTSPTHILTHTVVHTQKNTHTHSRHTQHSSTTEKLTNRAPKIRTVGGYRSLVARVAPVLAALPILSQAAHFRWLRVQVVAIHHCTETGDAHTPRRMQPKCASAPGAEEFHSNKHPSAVMRTFPHMLGRPTT